MKKRVFSLLLALVLLLSMSVTVFAEGEDEGDGNIDSGSGGMGSGTSDNKWTPGNDGVRVTIINADTGQPVGTPIDYCNRTQPSDLIHFGKVSKLHYLNGNSLSAIIGGYVYTKPTITLPTIISDSSGSASLEAIKRYFCSEGAAQMIANDFGISFVLLTGGKYKLFLEPIAYFIFNGNNVGMTAHEAALYDKQLSGGLRNKMQSLSHQNLPLAMFLERPDLGLPAFSGNPTTNQTNDTILSSLGMGIVSYVDTPYEPPEPGEADYEYRINTEVITSVTLFSTNEINPDSPATVTFNINGSIHTMGNVVIPAGESQLVWCKWTTPAIERTVTITVSTNKGRLSENVITAKVVDLNKNPPPDPKATDRNDIFTTPPVPNKAQKTSASWSVWRARWHIYWEWESDWQWISDVRWVSNWTFYEGFGWVDNGYYYDYGYWYDYGQWVDNGWYDFFSDTYTAGLNGSSVISPDEKVPTAVGKNMKSGYGVNNKVTANFTTNAPDSHVAGAQTAVSWFPEFKYNTYWRLLERISGIYMAQLEFRRNSYSTYNQRAHFLPVWYPDGTYTVYTWLLDAWTPAGMLSMNLSDYVAVQGSLFDDWYTNRE